jgi:hypothetical protein
MKKIKFGLDLQTPICSIITLRTLNLFSKNHFPFSETYQNIQEYIFDKIVYMHL